MLPFLTEIPRLVLEVGTNPPVLRVVVVCVHLRPAVEQTLDVDALPPVDLPDHFVVGAGTRADIHDFGADLPHSCAPT